MKMIILLMLSILTICHPVYAADWSWSKEDTAREILSAGLTIVDFGQTRDIRNHHGMVELNPILGRTPGNAAINRYFGTVLVLHPIISAILPAQADLFGFNIRPRLAWQYTYFGVELGAISSNYHGGLRLSF